MRRQIAFNRTKCKPCRRENLKKHSPCPCHCINHLSFLSLNEEKLCNTHNICKANKKGKLDRKIWWNHIKGLFSLSGLFENIYHIPWQQTFHLDKQILCMHQIWTMSTGQSINTVLKVFCVGGGGGGYILSFAQIISISTTKYY